MRIWNDPDVSPICSVTAYSAVVWLLRLGVVEGQQREAALQKYLIASTAFTLSHSTRSMYQLNPSTMMHSVKKNGKGKAEKHLNL